MSRQIEDTVVDRDVMRAYGHYQRVQWATCGTAGRLSWPRGHTLHTYTPKELHYCILNTKRRRSDLAKRQILYEIQYIHHKQLKWSGQVSGKDHQIPEEQFNASSYHIQHWNLSIITTSQWRYESGMIGIIDDCHLKPCPLPLISY